jgi:hypothetical protein
LNRHAAGSSRFEGVSFAGIRFELVSAAMLPEHDQSDAPHIKIFCSARV